jgi:hypothetical protein
MAAIALEAIAIFLSLISIHENAALKATAPKSNNPQK